MVNKSIEQTMWSITLMSSIQNIVSPKTWTQKVILKRSLIANTLPTWLTMEFDLFPLNIVGGVVSLASTWLTFEEDFLYSRQSNLPLAEFIFCNLWQTSIVWLCQTQLSHLRCARYLFEMCPTFLHIPHFRWGFLGVREGSFRIAWVVSYSKGCSFKQQCASPWYSLLFFHPGGWDNEFCWW